MADDSDRYCPACGHISPPNVQVCLCGRRFPPRPYVSPTVIEAPVVNTNGREGLAIAGMVLSIVGLVFFLLWPLALACAVVGFTLSAFGLNSNRRGMAIAGLICGLIGFVPAVFAAFGLFDLVISLWRLGVRPRVISEWGTHP